jgi:SAM-dependent methyltransferase
MKIELGGGSFGRGGEWINVDMVRTADVVHNLDVTPWPFPDDSIDAIYSSHCIEHVKCPISFLSECARVGRLGCEIEIRCPAPYSDLAMVAGHVSVFSPQGARNMDVHFPRQFWFAEKRPKLIGWHYQCSERLHEARAELPFLAGLSDALVMKYIPGTAHETVFRYVVQQNEFAEHD